MKLEIDFIDITSVEFGQKTCIKNNVLFINVNEAAEYILEDAKISDVSIELANPGEMTRIVNIQDVMQPRCKIDPEDADFPGYISKIQSVGRGATRALRGTAVVLCNLDSDRQFHSFLDMAGQIGKVSQFSQMPLVVMTTRKAEGVPYDAFDFAIHRAQLRLGVYLAKAGLGHEVSERRVYDHDFSALPSGGGLPRIAYFYQMYSPQYDHQGVSEPFFYGTEVRHILPTIMHPNEIIDGGIIGFFPQKGITTYHIQNHSMIHELYSRHNKDLIFCGVIIAVAHMNPDQRERRAVVSANLAKEILNADGVVMTKVHGGMMHMDLATTAEACERLGIRAIPVHQSLISAGTIAENALFKSEVLDAVVHLGVPNEYFNVHFKADRFIGGSGDTVLFSPFHILMRAKDEIVIGEEFLIPGMYDFTGGSKIKAVDY